MSEKTVKSEKNNTKQRVFRWILCIFVVLILEAIAIGGSFLINESRTKEKTAQIDSIYGVLNSHKIEIDTLKVFSNQLTQLSSNITSTDGNLKLLEENFNSLKQEVGNKKVDILTEKLANFSHRIESIEETKNTEALVLSIALMIKENALYGRDFSFEIDVLNKMTEGQENVRDYVQQLLSFKDKKILDNNTLANRFYDIEKDFSFEKKEDKNKEQADENTVSKSIKMIKETVASINLDKVVVMRKDNKTLEQKELLTKLKNYVAAYRFEEALLLIDNTPIFFNAENKEFSTWYNDLKNKVNFEHVISKLIASMLNTLREEIKNSTFNNNLSNTQSIEE